MVVPWDGIRKVSVCVCVCVCVCRVSPCEVSGIRLESKNSGTLLGWYLKTKKALTIGDH